MCSIRYFPHQTQLPFVQQMQSPTREREDKDADQKEAKDKAARAHKKGVSKGAEVASHLLSFQLNEIPIVILFSY